MNTTMNEIFGEAIHVYTREMAIGDGELVDVSELAAEAGFRLPVAVTRAAWADCVEWREADSHRKGIPQDETGRLWDMLWMARVKVGLARKANTDRVSYEVWRVPRHGRGYHPRAVKLTAIIGPGDAGEPVMTIGFPEDF